MSSEFVQRKIAVIGLGYVGLPLAVEFGKQCEVLGFDINEHRIKELAEGYDRTLEVTSEEIALAKGLRFSSAAGDLAQSDFFIVTVPTPIDEFKTPDLTALRKASEMIGKILKKGDIVVYESTVFPGCTEEQCVPVLEKHSGLVFNRDFYCGYSPERINPGDKLHTVSQILKVTSGSTPEIADLIDKVYRTIIKVGTYKATSIKVAEAAKVIENAQRDINIAFVNELSKIFQLLNIDTAEVLEAAATKWNFLKFSPGLVGGHCIGVDPYYLSQKAQQVGYHPEIILAGRRINDGMGKYVAGEVIKLMVKKQLPVIGEKVLIMGVTFKENCPDVRNTRVVDIVNELLTYDTAVDVYDPWADSEEVFHEYGLKILDAKTPPAFENYKAIVVAVAHDAFKEMKICTNKQCVVFDIKGMLSKEESDQRL